MYHILFLLPFAFRRYKSQGLITGTLFFLTFFKKQTKKEVGHIFSLVKSLDSWWCFRPSSVQGIKKEFHGFIFVLKGKHKEIMPGQREGVWGYSIK